MKTIFVSPVLSIAACLSLTNAQELRTITQSSGPVAIPANAIVQIVGVAPGKPPRTGLDGYAAPSMTQTFADGTTVTTLLCRYVGDEASDSIKLVGNVFSGVTSISIQNGNVIGYTNQPITAAVTIKIMSVASQVVSPPMILPVDDEIFSISLETSTDMQDWVPAFPGDYLGSSNHRFFRVKAIQKPAATPVAE